jgi:hypothetical protein
MPVYPGARISVLAPNGPTLYTPRGVPAHYFPLAGSRGLGQGPVYPIASPETADCGLPIRFCQTPLRPWSLQIDFPAATASAIRRSILPNNSLVR